MGIATTSGSWDDGTGIYYNGNKWHFFVDQWNVGVVSSDTTATTGIWYHIVGTFSSSGTLKLYINGVEEGTPVTSTTLDGLSNTYIIGSGASIEGEQANFQIWNSELTSSEVTTLYNGGRPYTGTQPQAANLKGWWKMNVDTSTWNGSNWLLGNSTANYTTALNFDGTNDYVNCGNDSSLQITDNLTVSVWFKILNHSGNRALVTRDTGSTQRNWSLYITSPGILLSLIHI